MADVNRLMKQFEQTRKKMMKTVAGGNLRDAQIPGRDDAEVSFKTIHNNALGINAERIVFLVTNYLG